MASKSHPLLPFCTPACQPLCVLVFMRECPGAVRFHCVSKYICAYKCIRAHQPAGVTSNPHPWLAACMLACRPACVLTSMPACPLRFHAMQSPNVPAPMSLQPWLLHCMHDRFCACMPAGLLACLHEPHFRASVTLALFMLSRGCTQLVYMHARVREPVCICEAGRVIAWLHDLCALFAFQTAFLHQCLSACTLRACL